MQIKTPNDEFFLLPRTVLPLLAKASASELRVLLYLYAWKQAEIPQLASQLGLTPSEAEAAVAFWRGAGVLEADESAPKKPVPASVSLFKNYDSHTIADHLEQKEDFRSCCDLVGEKLEKQLTKNDYSSLLYLYDYVGLPAELIGGVAEYCVSRGKKSMQYLMKTALRMYEEDGIDTYEKFEKHMAHLEKLNAGIGRVRRLCGMGERELSTKEQTILNRWFGEWELSYELIKLAFDKTVDSLGKVSLSYMNTMLKRWYEAGFTTPEDVAQKDKKIGGESLAGYGDSDEFFAAALKAGFRS